MIKIENVTCGYETDILKDVSVTIHDNKITFIIGKNGSGKSTLASVLTGLKKTKTGKIIIDDEEISPRTKIKSLRKKIGMVFQNPDNQIIFNRVYDDIKFCLDNINTPKDEIDEIIKETLRLTKMESFINSNPYNLSGGEKERIAISGILALKPKYIVFDEATSMLDAEGKKDIYEVIEKLKKEHIGIIFITNALEELIYADEIIIIDNKKLHKFTKEELFNDLSILKKFNLTIPFNLKVIDILNKKGIKTLNEKEVLKELDRL